jgi:hypothetical protein
MFCKSSNSKDWKDINPFINQSTIFTYIGYENNEEKLKLLINGKIPIQVPLTYIFDKKIDIAYAATVDFFQGHEVIFIIRKFVF